MARQRKANSPDCSGVEHACVAGLFQLMELLCESFGSAAAVLAPRITAAEQQIVSVTIEALLEQTVLVGKAGAELDAQHCESIGESRIVGFPFEWETVKRAIRRSRTADRCGACKHPLRRTDELVFVCSFKHSNN